MSGDPLSCTYSHLTGLLHSLVGPREIGSAGPSKLAAFDSNGLLSILDTGPIIPCGNAFNYSRQVFANWMPDHLPVGAPVTLSDNTTVTLRRAAASVSSAGHPWQLVVQKKVLRPFQGSQVLLSKSVFCSRPKGVDTFECCVEKKVLKPASDAKTHVEHNCSTQACHLGVSPEQFTQVEGLIRIM